MRAVTKKTVILATGGCAAALVACNAITGLSTDYNEVDCFGDSCRDASAPVDATMRDTGGRETGGPDGGPGFDAPPGVDAPQPGADATSDAPVGCDPQSVWAAMFSAPIVPPYHMAGLDLHGGDNGGITINEVAAAACATTDAGYYGQGMHAVSWGDAGEATFRYDSVSGRYYQMSLDPGYTGALDFHGPDGGASYHVAMGSPITKNGQPYELDWTSTPDGGRTIQEEATELKNAMIATYTPDGGTQSVNCQNDTTCAVFPGGDGVGTGVFGVRAPIYFYFTFGDTINHPNVPTNFYTFTPYKTFNDFTQGSYWTAFDTTQVAATVKAFAGIEYDEGVGALYLVPSGPTTPVARYNIFADAEGVTNTANWQTFDVTQLTPKPQGFNGGTFDAVDYEFTYFAGTNGICVQYDNASSFLLPSAWSSFDTTKLTPPATGFAGAAATENFASPTYIATVFAPANDGVAALYYPGTSFTTAANWTTFNLATVNPRLTKFRGAVAVGPASNTPAVYLVPNADTLVARWDATQVFNAAASWSTFDLATANSQATSYSTGAFDGRYLYFGPGQGGGIPVRYDTTLPFTTASSWQPGLEFVGKTTSMIWDAQYIYFSGSNSTITRYDTTKSFTNDPTAWTSVDVSQFNPNAQAFAGTAFDNRYLYFVPDTFSTLMRFDAEFPPGGPPRIGSFSTY